MLKLFTPLITLLLHTSLSASGGNFDKTKEASYELIVFGKVKDVVHVVLSEGEVALKQELKKEKDDRENNSKDHQYLTSVWTGKLVVDKVQKGDVKVGDVLTVTWTTSAMVEHIDLKIIPGAVRGSTGCESTIYYGNRLVFGLNATAKHIKRWESPIVWIATEGNPEVYEGKKEREEEDPFK